MRLFGILGLVLLELAAVSGCQQGNSVTSDESVREDISATAEITPQYAGSPVDVMGVKDPAICKTGEARIAVDSKVVGVTVGNRSRAYLLNAFSMPSNHHVSTGLYNDDMRKLTYHVVNDQLNGIPITVSYCDINACKQVFSSTKDASLNLRVGGMADGKMLLRHKDAIFAQDTASPPLDHYPFQVTTWGEWQTMHPATDIYLGDFYSGSCGGKAQDQSAEAPPATEPDPSESHPETQPSTVE